MAYKKRKYIKKLMFGRRRKGRRNFRKATTLKRGAFGFRYG